MFFFTCWPLFSFIISLVFVCVSIGPSAILKIRVLVYQQNNNMSRFGCFATEFFQTPVSHLSSFVSNHVLKRMFSGFLAAWSSSSEMEIAVTHVSLLGSRITSESNWFALHSMINVLHLENLFFRQNKVGLCRSRHAWLNCEGQVQHLK